MLLTIFSGPSMSVFPLRRGLLHDVDASPTQLQRHNKELAFLYRAGLALGAVTQFEQLHILNDVLYQLVHLLNGSRAFLWLVDQSKDEVCCSYAVARQRTGYLPSPTPLESQVDVQAEEGSAEANQSLMLPGEMLRRMHELQEPRVARRGKESAIFIPVLLEQQVVAIIEFVDDYSRRYSLSDVRLLESFAREVASALKNIRAFEQARRLAADEERKRFVANLHDAINQSLFSASIIAEVLPRLWDRDPVAGRTALSDLHHLVRGAAAELRGLLGDLQPRGISDAELPILLRQLADAFTGRTNVSVKIDIEGEGVAPIGVQDALYRTCHEALNNIMKHAHATEVTIALRYVEGGVQLSIEDNGQGFVPADVPAGHFGLGIMRDRLEAVGGKATVTSTPGKGTRITLSWAYDAIVTPQSASRLH